MSRWSDREFITIALSVAIGFMTFENLLAAIPSDQPLPRARDRLIAMLAGHPGYQIIMGYFISRAITQHRGLWWVPAVVIPVLMHGMFDFTDQAFQDEPNHGSLEDSILYGLWIGTMVVTVAVTGSVLCAVLRGSASGAVENCRED